MSTISGYVSPLLYVSQSQIASWFKADTGITLSGSFVTAWQDQSPNNRVAVPTNPAFAPVYIPSFSGSFPSIQFDGIDDRLEFTPVYDAGDIDNTVFVVGNLNNIGNNQGFVGTDSYRMFVVNNEGTIVNAGVAGSVTVYFNPSSSISLNNFFVGAFNIQNFTSSFYLNGIDVTGINGYVNPSNPQSLGAPFRLGAGSGINGTYQFPLNGFISEVLMISGSVSPQTILNISNALISKYTYLM